MNTARIVVLTIAVGAGGIAAYLASGSDPKAPAEPTIQLQTVDVLVAKNDIGLGQSVTADDVQWQTWPAATASKNFMSRNERPEAIKDIIGSIARSPFIAGEPIREPKLVKPNGSGFMAAILPTGMRAVSTEISPETGAGGFILPNDRVDVILSKREKNPDKGSPDLVHAEIILSNIRVLAIDQAPKEKDGQNSRGRQDRHARIEAGPGGDTGARAAERHAVAGLAQHCRCQRAGKARRCRQARRRRECRSLRHSISDSATEVIKGRKI